MAGAECTPPPPPIPPLGDDDDDDATELGNDAVSASAAAMFGGATSINGRPSSVSTNVCSRTVLLIAVSVSVPLG